MVLKNCGPKGYPGMAEVGNMGLPAKILTKGITDMVRLSDARMSGTAYGTVILHTAPEAAAGGPIAKLQDGDIMRHDAITGQIEVLSKGFSARAPVTMDLSDNKHGVGRELFEMFRQNVGSASEGAAVVV